MDKTVCNLAYWSAIEQGRPRIFEYCSMLISGQDMNRCSNRVSDSRLASKRLKIVAK